MSRLILSNGINWDLPITTYLKFKETEYSQTIDELVVFCLSEIKEKMWIQHTQRWFQIYQPDIKLSILPVPGLTEIETELDSKKFRELVYHYFSNHSPKHDIVAMAGGRKTMSIDLFQACRFFNTSKAFHCALKETGHRDSLLLQDPLIGQKLWEKAQNAVLIPITLDINAAIDLPEVKARLAEFSSKSLCLVSTPICTYADEVSQTRDQLHFNYLSVQSTSQSTHDSITMWPLIWTLSPREISVLRSTIVTHDHLELITQLPKAELHCHMGGILSLKQQVEMAQSFLDTISSEEKAKNMPFASLSPEWSYFKKAPNPAIGSALILTRLAEEELEQKLWDPIDGIRVGIVPSGRDFRIYSKPGDLTGSGALYDARVIPFYVQKIQEYMTKNGIHLMELRCSPYKYCNENGNLFLDCLYHEIKKQGFLDKVGVIICCNRSSEQSFEKATQLAIEAQAIFGDFIIGVDIAGNETGIDLFSKITLQHLESVYQRCIRMTVHAGEMMDGLEIWKACYHLHADRIGHGLSLADQPTLFEKIKARNIGIEMCPTSNLEVAGFFHPKFPETHSLKLYPLKSYLKSGIKVTINTDNPGISRTTLPQEFVQASLMTSEGLSLWDILLIQKNGFEQSFIPPRKKEYLFQQAHQLTFRVLKEFFRQCPI